MPARLVGLAAAALVLPAAALAWSPAQNAAFAKQLKTQIQPVFKKQAPTLALTKVTCVLPKEGTLVKCKAYFSAASAHANVVYRIDAKLQETGQIRWSTVGHTCTDAKTGKAFAC